MKKAMATHSSTLAWKIPWTEEPGGLESMGSQRVGHDWATSLSLFTLMHLAWKIPGMAEPGGLPSMGSRRVGHDWSDLAAAVAGKEKRVKSSREIWGVKFNTEAACRKLENEYEPLKWICSREKTLLLVFVVLWCCVFVLGGEKHVV